MTNHILNLEKIQQIKEDFYTDEVLKLIFFQLYKLEDKTETYREMAVLNQTNGNTVFNEQYRKIAFRSITFSDYDYLRRTLENLYFYNNDGNLYCSVARLFRIPVFPFKPYSLRREKAKSFYANYEKYIFAYDIFLDFDCTNRNELNHFLSEVTFMVKLFSRYDLDFEFVFSGNRGFKILIKNHLGLSIEEVSTIIENLVKRYSLNFVDFAGKGIPSKLMKINYSIAFKNNFAGIVFPLKKYFYQEFLNRIKNSKDFEIFHYNNIGYLQDFFNTNMNFLNYDDVNNSVYRENLLNFLKDNKLLKFDNSDTNYNKIIWAS